MCLQSRQQVLSAVVMHTMKGERCVARAHLRHGFRPVGVIHGASVDSMTVALRLRLLSRSSWANTSLSMMANDLIGGLR